MDNLIIIIILCLVFITTFVQTDDDDDINDLFCQMNEYARERAINNLKIFPCSINQKKN